MPSKGGSIENEAIPKSIARVLNAASVREEFRERKRKRGQGEDLEGSQGQPRQNKKRKRASDAQEDSTKIRVGYSYLVIFP